MTQPPVNSQPLMTFTSHIAGKNAKVSVYPDRIEWNRGGLSAGKVTAAALTLGASALVTGGVGNKSSEMLLMRSVSSVTSKKAMMNTIVQVVGAGGAIDFKCSHAEAERFKQLLLQLIR